MFHFGLLSTFVPYLLAAILYLIGMTSYAKGVLGIPVEENKAEKIISQDYSNVDSSQNIHFYDNIKDFIYELCDTLADVSEIDSTIRYTHNESFKDNTFYSYYFSRPPPTRFIS
jgi:hypothetical protein